jgi:DME family drug/metabolite transporter
MSSSSSSSARSSASARGSDILLAASLWGTSGTACVLAPAGPVAVGAARIIVGGGLLVLLTRGSGLRALLGRDHRTRLALLLGVVCIAVYQTAFFVAVGRTGVATGTIVTIGSAPAFTGLLSRERLDRGWLISTAGAVLGCVLLVCGGRTSGVEPVGVGLALLSGLGYAVYATITSRLIRAGQSGGAVVAVLFGGGGLLLIPVLLAGGTAWLGTGRGLGVALYLGAVTTAGAYLLFARGLRRTPVTVAATLGLAEPAVAAVLGVVILGERLGGLAVVGLALLVASLVVLVGWPSQPRISGPCLGDER